MALVGFDDPDWAASFNPSIISVAQKPYEMGYKATEMPFDRIEKKAIEWEGNRLIQLDTTLKIRESSGNFR